MWQCCGSIERRSAEFAAAQMISTHPLFTDAKQVNITTPFPFGTTQAVLITFSLHPCFHGGTPMNFHLRFTGSG